MQMLFVRILSQIDPNIDSEINIPRGELSNTSLAAIMEIAFGALGTAAFIIMVYAGMKFVLARGNSDGVAKARNTIIYAAVGLIISIMSFAIVRFVVKGVL
ncbi:MAG TPA: hypothetical protein PKD15_01185 [Candidatus Saccharibacteria bacterium]|jgi:cbb3-type cytochrome oxidase subunit 3|nr:hypothetical protein [Candidatus Saccharibacteria bacterium]